MTTIPQKITFGEMRSTGARDVLTYCRDFVAAIVSRERRRLGR